MIEASIQINAEPFVFFTFHTLPRIGEVIKIATKKFGPLEVEQILTVVNIIHLITPSVSEPNKNFHLISIVATRNA